MGAIAFHIVLVHLLVIWPSISSPVAEYNDCFIRPATRLFKLRARQIMHLFSKPSHFACVDSRELKLSRKQFVRCKSLVRRVCEDTCAC